MLKIRALHWIGTNLSAFRGKPRSVFSNSLHPESETMFFFRNLYPWKFCLMFFSFCVIGTILRNFYCHNCIFDKEQLCQKYSSIFVQLSPQSISKICCRHTFLRSESHTQQHRPGRHAPPVWSNIQTRTQSCRSQGPERHSPSPEESCRQWRSR